MRFGLSEEDHMSVAGMTPRCSFPTYLGFSKAGNVAVRHRWNSPNGGLMPAC